MHLAATMAVPRMLLRKPRRCYFEQAHVLNWLDPVSSILLLYRGLHCESPLSRPLQKELCGPQGLGNNGSRVTSASWDETLSLSHLGESYRWAKRRNIRRCSTQTRALH